MSFPKTRVAQNSVGITFRVTFVQPGSATPIEAFDEFQAFGASMSIILAPHDGPARVFDAILSGDATAATMEYATLPGDLDTFGPWRVQGRVANADGSRIFYTQAVEFEVTPSIDLPALFLRPDPVRLEALARMPESVG